MVLKSKDLIFGSGSKGSIGGTVMFISQESLKEEVTILEPSEVGFIGTNKPSNDGRQVSKRDVKGNVLIRPSYANGNFILQQYFDEVTGTFKAAVDPNGKTSAFVFDRGVDIYTYAACWLQELALSGNENESIEWLLTLLGTTEVNAGAVGALTPPDRMLFSDLTLTIATHTYFPIGFTWKFMYDFEERFHNSLTRSHVMSRIPRVEISLIFDVNSDTFADLFVLAGGVTQLDDVNLVFADGSNTLSLLVPKATVMNPSKWADAEGVSAQQATLELRAWLDDGTETEIFTMTYV